jgi:hypothetical protein
MRAAALIALVAGAVGSVAFLLRAGSRNSSLPLLVVLFTIWVLAPFVVLAWAVVVSTRWSAVTQTTLYCVALAVTLGSLACYGGLVKKPEGSPNVFMFVAIPPASVLLMTFVPIVALVARRRRGVSARTFSHRP